MVVLVVWAVMPGPLGPAARVSRVPRESPLAMPEVTAATVATAARAARVATAVPVVSRVAVVGLRVQMLPVAWVVMVVMPGRRVAVVMVLRDRRVSRPVVLAVRVVIRVSPVLLVRVVMRVVPVLHRVWGAVLGLRSLPVVMVVLVVRAIARGRSRPLLWLGRIRWGWRSLRMGLPFMSPIVVGTRCR